MPKFFIEKQDIINDTVTVSGSDAAHIQKVLRLDKGDCVTLCDGEGTDFDAEIIKTDKQSVTFLIKDSAICESEPKIEVTLFQGLPKQAKMDYIIEKCTELGISKIVPVLAKRSVAAIRDDKAEDKKLTRWRKIAAESVKQCKRGKVPEVTDVKSFDEIVGMLLECDLAIVPYENETANGLKTVLCGKTPKTVGIFIGPEGGIADEEIDVLLKNNVKSVTLGKRILRTETAGHATLAAVMYEYGEFN